jgi:RNA polymerase sigma factor (sigma-70 family)
LAHEDALIAQGLLDDVPEHLGRVMRWISTILASPAFWSLRAEWLDLHQEVLLRVVESLRRGRYDPTRDLRQYVQGIARLTALQALDRQATTRRARVPVPMTDRVEPEWARHLTNRQAARWVLDAASEDCRGLFIDYFFREMSYASIAAARSLPVGTVKSRLFRCLETAYRTIKKTDETGNRADRGANILRTKVRG